jgi:hypothetical protein
MNWRRLAAPFAAVLALAVCGSTPLSAGEPATAAPAFIAAPSDVSAQARRYRRAQTRIEVYPRRRHLGPNAKRDCISWLEPEWRLSGTVIVPRLRCWWLPG